MPDNDNLLANALKTLDFSDNDTRVYLALVRHEPCPAGPLIQATRLHRNIVYTSLAHLIERKLATERQVRGTKHFSLTSPTALLAEFRAKQEQAEQAVSMITQLRSQESLEEITVHQGNEEYLQLLTGLIRQLPQGGTKYVLGTGGAAFMDATMLPIWRRYHKVALEQKIGIKMISFESQRAALTESVKHPPIYDVRYLPDTSENPSGIHIYPEAKTVLNIIYSDESSPVTAIKIVNPKLVRGYLHLFGNLWKQAKA